MSMWRNVELRTKRRSDMILETQRLIMRPFTEGDAEDVYAYLVEPLVNCYASMRLNAVDAAKEEMKKRSSETKD